MSPLLRMSTPTRSGTINLQTQQQQNYDESYTSKGNYVDQQNSYRIVTIKGQRLTYERQQNGVS
jgi:hypothetical protein